MRSYSTFIRKLEDEMVEAVRQVENLEWHHLPERTDEYQHYVRLLTWATEVSERRVRFDYIKAGRATRRSQREVNAWVAEANRVGGHPAELHAGGRSAVDTDPSGGALGQGRHGNHDGGEADN